MSSISKPIYQEFKNAIHVSKNAAQSADNLLLEFSPQKGLRKDPETHSQISIFGQSSLSRHFKEINLTANKSKSLLQGFGITIDDYGHLILAEWKGNQIDGRYFLFKPNLIEQNDQNSSFSAICQYGFMRNGNLEGENYVYNINGTLAKGSFEQNKIVGKCFIIHSNKLFIANQINQMHKVQCEIVNFSATESEIKKSENSNVLKIPKIKSLSQKQGKGGTEVNKFPSNFEQVDVNIFTRPNKFLEDMIKSHKNSGKDTDSIATIAINDREYFVGFVENERNKSKQSTDDEMLRINGLGAIFKNEWPTCYGFFKEGKLEGLGRVYETQMNLYDGFFANGEIMQGFIIDYYAHTTSFGHHSAIDNEYKTQEHEEDCFIITNTFDTVSSEYIIEYKKNFHLKSLNFNNSYFNSPKLIHRSPWPYNIINKLNKRTQIQSIIKSFRPSLRDMEISAIEKVGQSTQNRLEKELIQEIKETNPSVKNEVDKSRLLKQKSNFIKNEITKNLKEKAHHEEENHSQKVLSKYINEYQVLQKKKTEIIKSREKKPQSKEEPSQQNQTIIEASFVNSSMNNQLILTPRKQKSNELSQIRETRQQDLSYLVKEYHQCQTERKNSMTGGNTTRRTNTDRKYSPREIYSKRSLIQQDHNHFMGKQKASKTPKYTNSTRKKVDLDLIYRQYLQK